MTLEKTAKSAKLNTNQAFLIRTGDEDGANPKSVLYSEIGDVKEKGRR